MKYAKEPSLVSVRQLMSQELLQKPHLVKDVIVVGLCYTDELTIVYFGSHHPTVIQFLHGRRYAKTKTQR